MCPQFSSQKQVRHQPAPLCRRRTASSSTSCLIWAAPGSKPHVMRPRHREPWRRCVLRVPCPSPSPCMSRVDPMAQSGQSHSQKFKSCHTVLHHMTVFDLRSEIVSRQDHGPGFRNRDRLFSHLQGAVLCSWTGGFGGEWLFLIHRELPELWGFPDSRLLLPHQGGSKFQHRSTSWRSASWNQSVLIGIICAGQCRVCKWHKTGNNIYNRDIMSSFVQFIHPSIYFQCPLLRVIRVSWQRSHL